MDGLSEVVLGYVVAIGVPEWGGMLKSLETVMESGVAGQISTLRFTEIMLRLRLSQFAMR